MSSRRSKIMRLDDWQRDGRVFGYRGHEIFYRREGSGQALVLLHGFPTASWDWHRLWSALTRRFDLIAPDMIGFGFSSKPSRYDYSLMDQASLHETLLEELGVSSAHILAHDYGDTVAQELLARFAERRRKARRGFEPLSVCLLNGGIFPGVHRPLLIQKLLTGPLGGVLTRVLSRGTLKRSFGRIFGPKSQPSDAEIDDFWRLIEHNGGRRVLHKLIRYMAEREQHAERWVGALQTTSAPLCLIDGVYDPISGAHVAEHFRGAIPRADVVELQDIGHYPQIEAPEAVLEAFLGFVDERVRGQRR